MDSQLLLNGMLPPFKRFARSIKANDDIFGIDKAKLYEIVGDCLGGKENYKVKRGLVSLAPIIVKYSKQGSDLPFLIKQVMFCLTVNCVKYERTDKWTQEKVLAFLNGAGVSNIHNFFTKLGYTPTKYWNTFKEEIPAPVVGYMGQKKGELGVAVRNLVYQAGKYDVFYDVFGGSGAASLAVSRIAGATYVYNELNNVVFNLFSVIADKALHLELIKALRVLQKYIYEGGEQLGDTDLDSFVANYFKNVTNESDIEILAKGYTDFGLEAYGTNKFMYEVYDSISDKPESFVMVAEDGTEYTRQELLDLFQIPENADISDLRFSIMFAFLRNHTLLFDYAKNCTGLMMSSDLPDYKPDSNGLYTDNLNVIDQKFAYRQIRCYTYFAYFNELLKANNIPQDKKVLFAVGEIFRHFFAFSGRTGETSILSTLRRSYPLDGQWDKKGSYIISDFIEFDFAKRIKEVHNIIEGTVCMRKDFSSILKENKDFDSPLYYVDPPYVATTGYEEKNKVAKFTKADMEKLIHGLVDSGDKFIYSCRAVKDKSKEIDSNKTTEAARKLMLKANEDFAKAGQKTTIVTDEEERAKALMKRAKDKIAKANEQIFSSVFAVFAEYIALGKVDDFYVLAIKNPISQASKSVKKEEDAYTLPWSIRHNQMMELMITNFEICSFADEAYPNIDYTVYKFTDFLGYLLKYANVNLGLVSTPEEAAMVTRVMKNI